jgi:hypothetical protein
MVIIDESTLITSVINSQNFTQVMRNMKRADSSAGRKTIKKYIELYGIDISHFETPKERYNRSLNKTILNQKIKLEDILVKNSTYNSGNKIKKRLYEEGLKNPICEKCGQDEWWHGERISLILDHINGDHYDNRIENLRIVCPNCEGTLPTHCRGYKKINNIRIKKDTQEKNKIKRIKNQDKHFTNLSLSQRKVKRPEFDSLKKEVNELGYSGTGRKYGVSDNAIRKWIKFYQKHNLKTSE